MPLTVSDLAHSNSDELVCSIHRSTSACSSYICDDCICYSILLRPSRFTKQDAVEVPTVTARNAIGSKLSLADLWLLCRSTIS